MNLTYAFSHRWSAGLSIPLLHGQANVVQGDGQRHTFSSGLQIGDVRLMASAWVLDPNKPHSGNFVLSLGVKAPTGRDDVKDDFYTAGGKVVVPIDISTQPGDNGWGIVAQAQGFQLLPSSTFFYGNGFYLASLKEKNDTVTPASAPHTLSAADQYMARAGVGYAAWPEKEISLSLGFRLEGVTRRDLVGGDGGFRRPGYVLSIEPGVTVSRGPHVFSVYVPIAVERNRQQNVIEEALSKETGTTVNGGGALPSYSVVLTYSRRFASKRQLNPGID